MVQSLTFDPLRERRLQHHCPRVLLRLACHSTASVSSTCLIICSITSETFSNSLKFVIVHGYICCVRHRRLVFIDATLIAHNNRTEQSRTQVYKAYIPHGHNIKNIWNGEGRRKSIIQRYSSFFLYNLTSNPMTLKCDSCV